MHILLLTVSYKSTFNPLSAPFFRDQALALKNNGCKVGVICPLPVSLKSIWENKLFSFYEESYVDEGITTLVTPFPSLPKMPNRARRIRLNKGKQLFKKYINENKIPDIIHVHSFLAGELAIWIKDKYNIPYVVTEHSSSFERKLLSISNTKLARNVFENSNCNIAVSKSLSDAIKCYFKELDFKIVPNIIDTNFFSLKDKKEKNHFQFINIAHLNKNKNQLHLIKSFTKSFKGNLKYKLLIVGQGPERNTLEQCINYNNMNSQIKLFGGANRQEVKDLLHQSDCFVLSSKVETFGVVIVEAMSCGLPILSTKCGGPDSIITNDSLGILCSQENLSEKMKYISQQKFGGNIIRKHVINSFSNSSLFEQLKVIYFDCKK
jgi:glycosyltransferase involved in cell wall biosynthesis